MSPVAPPKYLLYHEGEVPLTAGQSLEVLTSPATCLHEAMEKDVAVVFISLYGLGQEKRDLAIELCRVLDSLEKDKKPLIYVLLTSPNRDILQALSGAGVTGVLFCDPMQLALHALHPQNMAAALKCSRSPEQELASICPHLLAELAGDGQDIHFCRAYRSIMVVNKTRIRSFCVDRYSHCQYYKNPIFSQEK
ncbi:hypothetical protein PCS_00323 [Desulfocurvibacter africanus PCS]|uniref:Uncharacterized protein n=1 Tax=Desulfocurvibacter africanus PCS TaxID=1262666 RepID=M5Q3M2_DESAF|nr:hypothetical protein [Desulfocurvibacter africanus]EMG38693.1 hypothetical protein PCS_00323 [Desulfocurvibacter africanus PCS]